MADGNALMSKDQARAEAYGLPLEKLNPAQPALFQADAMWPMFERLRAEDPVHYCTEHEFGPYWSITKYNDIMAIDTDHNRFSSDFMKGGITIAGGQANMDPLPMFIAMDPPQHDDQRKVVQPIVAPDNLAKMEGIIRARAKIEATIGAARIYCAMGEAGEDFSGWLWGLAGGDTHVNDGVHVPASTPVSEAMSKALKARGFKFVGPVIVYAFMQAVGMVNDHAPRCFRRGASPLP